jgi:putative tryptophan/tyrosine transport system substrate-binding protein
MRRREFIAGLGGAAAWPLVARAQQSGRVRQIGILGPGDETGSGYWPLFVRGLEELGWVSGRNLQIEFRFAEGNVDRMRVLARELSDLRPDVIVVSSAVATRAVQEQTRTIPIVFVYAGDPIASGIVTNIARPEGNTTGVNTDPIITIGGKWLELFKEAVPRLARVALIFNPDFKLHLTAIEAAAAQYGVKAIRIAVHNGAEIESTIDAFATEPDGGIIVVPPVSILPAATQVINRLALRHRLPTFYNYRLPTFYNSGTSVVADGALMSYGADPADLFRRSAPNYVDRILRGAKPSELPVLQFSAKIELVINLKTAKAIGLTIPESFLLRADELIE